MLVVANLRAKQIGQKLDLTFLANHFNLVAAAAAAAAAANLNQFKRVLRHTRGCYLARLSFELKSCLPRSWRDFN